MYYGLDIGGTKIEFGAFDVNLQRVMTKRIPTPQTSYQALLDAIAELVEQADLHLACRGAVGIGLPGMEQVDTGQVLTVNIAVAKGKTLRKDLECRLNRPVALENDANCFALSEANDERLANYSVIAGLIMGTGFGGGVVINGQVVSGHNHVAGEVGHMKLSLPALEHLGSNPPIFYCGCGAKGCLDSYLSGRGFELLYNHYYSEELSAVEIISKFSEGDGNVSAFVDFYLELVAICLADLMMIIDPEAIVIGGGLSNFDELYQKVPSKLDKHLLSVAKAPEIIKAKYGDAGGVRGAAFLNL